jgi:hypothetical protein
LQGGGKHCEQTEKWKDHFGDDAQVGSQNASDEQNGNNISFTHSSMAVMTEVGVLALLFVWSKCRNATAHGVHQRRENLFGLQ